MSTAPTTDNHIEPTVTAATTTAGTAAAGGSAVTTGAAATGTTETDAGAGTVNGTGDAQNGDDNHEKQAEDLAAPEDIKLPTRKDVSLREFLNKMDDYAPIIPDAVTNYYMTRAGLPPPPTTDQRLSRLLALATQKFVADIAADAYQYSRIRASNTSANNPMGNLGAAAGIPMPGQSQGAPGGGPGGVGGAGGGAGGGAKDAQTRALGIQRAGYGGGGQGGSANRTVLTMEDLGMAVGEYGVNVKRSEFYR